MMIEAEFKNADQVSKGLGIDNLNLNFVWPPFFKTQQDGILLKMNYKLRVQLPLQMKPEKYKSAVKEGMSLESFSRFGSFIGLFFILISTVSCGLLFCSVELFQLLTLQTTSDQMKIPPRFKILLGYFEFVVQFKVQ